MSDLNFTAPLGNNFRSFFSVGGDLITQTITPGAGVGSFVAAPFSYYKDITINRIGLNYRRTGGTSVGLIVGISTSLQQYGYFPSTTNNSVSIGGSINFSAVSTTRTLGTVSSSTYTEVNLESDYFLPAYKNVFLCTQIVSLVGAASVTAAGPDLSNDIYENGKAIINVNNTLASAEGNLYLIAGYWSGSGDTIWYVNTPTCVDSEIIRSNHPSPGREWGCEFEINDLNVQNAQLQDFSWFGMKDSDGNVVYTCRIYDENFSIVGTAITEKGYNQISSSSINYAYTFHFIPPIDINPNYRYYVGIAGTGQSTTNGTHTVLGSASNQLPNIFDQKQRYVFRDSPTAPFSSLGDTCTANVFFTFGTSNRMRRGQGN